ncbi:Response gene to complement 32 protein [Chelonia mydas]|uniref:Response gene to complement 32 protein n=1 Tax=Chelonia mydas TaxID=8469 RepID=M7B2A2_CHEMY|nr:Response gene to complement 32 protein [Chelonia mydas]
MARRSMPEASCIARASQGTFRSAAGHRLCYGSPLFLICWNRKGLFSALALQPEMQKRRAFPPLIMASPTENMNNAVLPDDLHDLLREFDEVIEDFDKGEVCQYEQHLEELKRRTLPSVYDSGIDELESTSTSPGSSLNSSEEDLNTSASTANSKAKLGDTQELEEFIADLDKVLEGFGQAFIAYNLGPDPAKPRSTCLTFSYRADPLISEICNTCCVERMPLILQEFFTRVTVLACGVSALQVPFSLAEGSRVQACAGQVRRQYALRAAPYLEASQIPLQMLSQQQAPVPGKRPRSITWHGPPQLPVAVVHRSWPMGAVGSGSQHVPAVNGSKMSPGPQTDYLMDHMRPMGSI